MSGLAREPVALLLAAGKGSRLGADKPFVDVGGRPLLERALRPFRKSAHVEDVLIVVGPDATPRFEHLRTPRIHIVENPDPEGGMITSIRIGLQNSWSAERNFLICPADLPYIKPEMVDRIVRMFLTRGVRIVLPAYRGLGGHPGMFDNSLRDDFFMHGDQHGAREVIRRHMDDTARLNVEDPDICFDIDTPEDLAIATDAGARWARIEAEVEARKKMRYR